MADEGKSSRAGFSRDGLQAALANMKDLRWWGDFLLRNAICIAAIFLAVCAQIYSIQRGASNTFLSFAAFIDIAKRGAELLFMALGMGGIIVLGGVDLSAGRAVGLTACVCGSLLQKPISEYASKMLPRVVDLPVIGWIQQRIHPGYTYEMFAEFNAPPIILVLLLSIAIGGIVGIVNGFCVAKLKLRPFIATIATQLMLFGAAIGYMYHNNGNPISGYTVEYKEAVRGSLLVMPAFIDENRTPVPYYVFYAIIAAVAMWFIWNKTTLGKNMYAVGANPESANVSGVSVLRTTIFVFMIAGILYGVSGFVNAAMANASTVLTGDGEELDAIAACVIGGVSLKGGVGKISGVIKGVAILIIIRDSLPWLFAWLRLPTSMVFITKGLIIIAACAIDMRKRRQMG